jgi:hypothetical protein
LTLHLHSPILIEKRYKKRGDSCTSYRSTPLCERSAGGRQAIQALLLRKYVLSHIGCVSTEPSVLARHLYLLPNKHSFGVNSAQKAMPWSRLLLSEPGHFASDPDSAEASDPT